MSSPTPVVNSPKYVAIAGELKAQIERGILQPGDRLPSFVEMRTRFGVTPTTVERIYGLLERENLIVREQGRGTFVLGADNRPSTGIVGLSGLTYSRYTHPYFNHVIEGIQEVAVARGIELLLLNPDSVVRWEKMDGLIIHKTQFDYSDNTLRNLPVGMPCVGVLNAVRDHISIIGDDYQGAYDLTRHFIDLGHRKIAYIYDPQSQRRLAGYRDALRDAGGAVDERCIRPLPPYDSIYVDYGGMTRDVVSDWLKNGWDEVKCTAIMAQNDDGAIGAFRALQEAGCAVPGDVSIAGYDGTEIGRHFSPSITSIETPLREIGATALDILLRLIQGDKIPVSTTVLPARLLNRESSGPAPSISGGDC